MMVTLLSLVCVLSGCRVAFGATSIGSRAPTAAPEVAGYEYLGFGFCDEGYIGGWEAVDAVNHDACRDKCNSEPECKYFAIVVGHSCSRYDERAGECDDARRPWGRHDHTTWKKLPSVSPTRAPSDSPSEKPTRSPTRSPSRKPTAHPTFMPSKKPTAHPTAMPSRKPTAHPTDMPSRKPTAHPTGMPSRKPTAFPTRFPSRNPTALPTHSPTRKPTTHPTHAPSRKPTAHPTHSPTHLPTHDPTPMPTDFPTELPTPTPTEFPTEFPTPSPSDEPTAIPTPSPSEEPTAFPTLTPSDEPTAFPTFYPSVTPSSFPTLSPTTLMPTATPTLEVGVYSEMGVGFCDRGYMGGWKAEDAVDLLTCKLKCDSEPDCRYFAFIQGRTCSRYDFTAGDCDRMGDDHYTYKKEMAPSMQPTVVAVEGYERLGEGHCLHGYIGGWEAEHATSYEACREQCNKEENCKFFSINVGRTCSRYDSSAGNCDVRAILTDVEEHETYRKMEVESADDSPDTDASADSSSRRLLASENML